MIARRCGVLLLFASAMLLMAAGWRMSVLADATCQVTMQYTGTFPEVTWTGQWQCVKKACPTSGECAPKLVEGNPDLEIQQCACPSGGGADGCRGRLKATRNAQGVWSYTLECTGGCREGETCDWAAGAQPSGQSGNWGVCKCQGGSDG